MREYSPVPYQQDTETQQTWERDTLADALHTAPDTVHDVAFGDGHRFHVGQEHSIQLEVFPDAQAARITTSHARLELFRQEPPTASSEGVIFHTTSPEQITQVHIQVTGDEVFSVASQAVRAPTEPFVQPVDSEIPDDATSPATAASTRPQQQSKQHRTKKRGQQEQAEKEKVEIVGNVATKPTFKQTNKGLMMTFRLAEHPDTETTVYHTVTAFRERAAKNKDTLTVGQAVKIVGKPFTWQPEPKKGKPKEPETRISMWGLTYIDKTR